MFITRESDYAIRIIRALACGEIRTVHDICADEKVPKQFAYKILKKLERGKLVRVQRGAHGGYRLWKQLSDITLYDILVSVTESLSINECLTGNSICKRNLDLAPCAVHLECKRLEDLIVSALQEKSMETILSS